MKFLNFLFIILFFIGCADKTEEYNKPAIYWYNKMIDKISIYQLEQADDIYTSLESEHKHSPLVPTAMMVMAQAHMDEEEYIMVDFYLDLYIKRFGTKQNIDYVKFLKIKSKFLAFKHQFREQKLIINTIKDIDTFLQTYPKSQYSYLALSIKSRLLMEQSLFDYNIADLYDRIDKPKASLIYVGKAKVCWDKPKEIKKAKQSWYRWLFE